MLVDSSSLCRVPPPPPAPSPGCSGESWRVSCPRCCWYLVATPSPPGFLPELLLPVRVAPLPQRTRTLTPKPRALCGKLPYPLSLRVAEQCWVPFRGEDPSLPFLCDMLSPGPAAGCSAAQPSTGRWEKSSLGLRLCPSLFSPSSPGGVFLCLPLSSASFQYTGK